MKIHGVSFVGRKCHWRCFDIVTLLRHCMILLCSSLRMKTQDLVSDNLPTVTLMSPYLSKGVAFGEPSRSPCVVTVVLDAAVGYCVP